MTSTYEIQISKQARKQLLEIPEPHRYRISQRIDALKANPRPPGVEKMSGFDAHYRIRIGPYRVIYLLQDRILTIEIIRVGARKDIYRGL